MSKYNFTDLKRNLESKGYSVSVFEKKEDAANYINEQVNQKSIGLGGSVTIHEMNLFEILSSHNVVYWHDKKPDDMTIMETRTAASRAEVYISSVNAISEVGEIVNIDNTGNRVAAISYGPAKIYLVIGSNKVTADLESAIYRARNIASPLNAKRLNRKTPCAVNGDRCYDCNSPERICRNLSVLWNKPTGADYEVILIEEKLGF
ncbi:MAG: lactate utilization protein [Lachnospiraceae bacterium]|nr:lactate utilization protein [Lachnospiraceae bacterium]